MDNYQKAKDQAMMLLEGKTIDRRDMIDFEVTEMYLRTFKNNCNRVLRQLKNR